jgi:hypothetical protein
MQVDQATVCSSREEGMSDKCELSEYQECCYGSEVPGRARSVPVTPGPDWPSWTGAGRRRVRNELLAAGRLRAAADKVGDPPGLHPSGQEATSTTSIARESRENHADPAERR